MEILTVNSFQNDGSRKKKRRLGKSCLSCRERKIKCDQVRPRCTSCEQKFIEDCIYDDQKISDRTKAQTTINERVAVKDDAKKNIFQDNVGEKKFEAVVIKPKKTLYYGLTSEYPMITKNETAADYVKQVRYYLKGDSKEWKKRNKVNRELDFNYVEDLDRLIKQLPDIAHMKNLLNQYFDSIWYISMPIVDKETILDDFQRLFISENNEIQLRLNQGVDYSTLSLLLIIMKYMIQIDKNSSEKYPIFLSSNDIFLNLIEGLRPNDGIFLKRSSLPALQALLLQRIFKKFNFKDNDNGEHRDGSIMFSIAFEMAMVMGLHRDIDKLYCNTSDSYRHCLKEIWKCLMYYDTWNSLDIGIPLKIQDGFYDSSLLQDRSDPKVELIVMLRTCCNKLSKFEVFEEDLQSCILIIKGYLEGFDLLFSYIDILNSTQDLFESVIMISNLMAALGLLQHLNHVLATFHIDNEELYAHYDKISTKYSFLSVASVSAMIKILQNRLRKDDQNIFIVQGYFFAIGISLCYSTRPVFTLMMNVCENSKSSIMIPYEPIKIAKLATYNDDPETVSSFGEEFNNTVVLLSILMQLLEGMFTENDDISVYSYFSMFSCIRIFKEIMSKVNENWIQDSRVIIDYSGCVRIDPVTEEVYTNERSDPFLLSKELAFDVTKLFEQFFGNQ